MGKLTPVTSEYNLQSNFIAEALDLLGQECKLYLVKNSEADLGRDVYYDYESPVDTCILFADVMSDNKVNKDSYWQKETNNYIEAYLKLPSDYTYKDAIVSIEPLHWNKESRFIIKDVYGQINSIYNKVHLVPYRKSKATDESILMEDKHKEFVTDIDGVIKHKNYLNRSK